MSEPGKTGDGPCVNYYTSGGGAVVAKIHEIRPSKNIVSEPMRTFGLLGLVGNSPQMKEVFELVQKVAPTDLNVLIAGETGVGKECLVRALHMLSRRRNRPLVALNCTAVPESLLESQLFGYVKGAFTGHRKLTTDFSGKPMGARSSWMK